MKQAKLEEEIHLKEVEALCRVAELERKLEVAQQRPMATPPEEWTCHIGNQDVMILPLPVPMVCISKIILSTWSCCSSAYFSTARSVRRFCCLS